MRNRKTSLRQVNALQQATREKVNYDNMPVCFLGAFNFLRLAQDLKLDYPSISQSFCRSWVPTEGHTRRLGHQIPPKGTISSLLERLAHLELFQSSFLLKKQEKCTLERICKQKLCSERADVSRRARQGVGREPKSQRRRTAEEWIFEYEPSGESCPTCNIQWFQRSSCRFEGKNQYWEQPPRPGDHQNHRKEDGGNHTTARGQIRKRRRRKATSARPNTTCRILEEAQDHLIHLHEATPKQLKIAVTSDRITKPTKQHVKLFQGLKQVSRVYLEDDSDRRYVLEEYEKGHMDWIGLDWITCFRTVIEGMHGILHKMSQQIFKRQGDQAHPL